jgi:hypothetical protein
MEAIVKQMNHWLEDTQSRCARLAEAYRLQLGRLWWANLCFVVCPAVFSTAAAVLAAIPEAKVQESFGNWFLPPASVLAGLAAILVAVHKALKCDEYQAECMRLSHAYQAVAEAATYALSRPDNERGGLQEGLASELMTLTKRATTTLPTRILAAATQRFEESKLAWLPRPAADMSET